MIASEEILQLQPSALPHLAVLYSPATVYKIGTRLPALQYLCKPVLALSLALCLRLLMPSVKQHAMLCGLPAEAKFVRCNCCNAIITISYLGPQRTWRKLSQGLRKIAAMPRF